MRSTISAKKIASTICIVFGVLLLATIPINIAGKMETKMIIVGGVAAAILIFLGIRTRATVSKFKEYVGFLSEDPTGSIDELAAKCGEPVEKVRKNLDWMILKRYFAHAHIDEETNSIVLTSAAEQSHEGTQTATDESVGKTVSVKCGSCGAICAVPEHGRAECGYCGNSVTAE